MAGDRSGRTGTNVVLIGFMGSGKTEVGRLVATQTGRKFVDVDALIEAGGVSIADIFAAEGETGFRRRERAAVRTAARTPDAVIATGGGAVLDPANVAALKKSGVLFYLDVDEPELVRRLADSTTRPMLYTEPPGPDESPASARRVRIVRLLAERRPAYEDAADVIIKCGARKPAGVAKAVLSALGVEERRRTVRVEVQPAYDVIAGRGLLERIGDLGVLPEGAAKAFVVTHPRVWKLWGGALSKGLRRAGLDVVAAPFPEGESKKTPATAAVLASKLAAQRFRRTDVVISFGGGVAGDVGGFVASTYARGISVVQVPTTLLAMCDAAIGGKTGVNLPEGKNLWGTFWQPTGVVCDLDTLRTLPARETRGGLAEVVKYGFIAEPDLVDLAAAAVHDPSVMEDVVVRSASIKASIVASDPTEQGVRAHLNYGHTLGHALEALGLRAGRVTLNHGECVSIGMVFAAWVSELAGCGPKGLAEEHIRALKAVGLPVGARNVAWSDVRSYMDADKKFTRQRRLVLLEKPGRPVVRDDIPPPAWRKAFAKILED